MQFGYFTRLQSWAPMLIPALFFVLGNVAGVLVRNVAERHQQAVAGPAAVRAGREHPQVRQQGVVLDAGDAGTDRPGVTTYDEVLRLCGPDVEEQLTRDGAGPPHASSTGAGGWCRGGGGCSGWLATVHHWDVEQHEVGIELERDVVRDVQARVRRSRLASPEAV